jgi:cell pole-organizing protein PopZ
MEDILASIRRILNEGEGDAAAPAEEPTVAATAPVEEVHVAKPEKEIQPASTPANEPVEVEDVFILDTAMMVADTAVAEPAADEAPIASSETMAAASQSVGALKKALSERHAQVYKAQAISLEEIVREEVRPMLKSWLDAHLPAIVERLVRTEIERVVAREML